MVTGTGAQARVSGSGELGDAVVGQSRRDATGRVHYRVGADDGGLGLAVEQTRAGQGQTSFPGSGAPSALRLRVLASPDKVHQQPLTNPTKSVTITFTLSAAMPAPPQFA
jgi:hypothetical protein